MTGWGEAKIRLRLKGIGSWLVRGFGLRARRRTLSLTSAQRLRQLRISYELLHELTMDLQAQLANWNGGSWPRRWSELRLHAEPPLPHSQTGKGRR